MRKTLLFFLLLFICIKLPAQNIIGSQANIYALVVGISDYKDDRITDLNFAHRDAQIFADYLKSKAGGSVPDENINLLIDTSATNGAIYEGLHQLKVKAQSDDKVIIYFSGHGDVETDEYNPLGFLLAYDTPFNCYRTSAVRVSDLNLDASTLIKKNNAKVVFFIDACHSGQLAGTNNNGSSKVANALAENAEDQVRIMSCKPDEKSLELSELDGGRGVFSYFLIKGLIGEAADGEDDFQISLEELNRYIKDNVKKIAKEKNHPQNPVIKGEDDFQMAFVDESVLKLFKIMATNAFSQSGISNNKNLMASKSVDNEEEKEKVTNAKSVGAKAIFKSFDDAILQKRLLDPADNSAYHIYKKLLKSNPKDVRLPKMKSKLIIAFQDEAQGAINAYLRGDQEELNRRIYIEESKAYEKYPAYLEKAAELVGKDYPSYDAIKAKQYYFEGINYRLKNMVRKLSKKNLRTTMNLQKKALEHDEAAAFVHNEIGVLHMYLDQYDLAGASFKKAMSIAPTWAVPYSNYGIMLFVNKKYDEAENWSLKSIELQPEYIKGQIYYGAVKELKGNYLTAERYYRNAIYHNWNNHQGFQKLAYLYTYFGDYKLADHLFLEMELRQIGMFPNMIMVSDVLSQLASDTYSPPEIFPSEASLLERIRNNPLDYDAWYTLGRLYISEQRIEEAETCFLEVVKIKPDLYDVYLNLGDMYAAWNRYEDAIDAYYVPIDSFGNFQGLANTCAERIWNLLEELERNEETEDLMELYVFELKGNKDLLKDFYTRMVRNYPDDADFWYKRGMWYYDQFEGFRKENNDASWVHVKDDFEETIALDSLHPSRGDIFLKLGDLYAWGANIKHRKTFIRNNMKVNPEDEGQFLIYNDYVTYMQNAVKNTEASHHHRPEQIGPRFQLIDQYLAFYEPEKATALLETLVDSSQLNFETRRQLIHTYALNGEPDKAKPVLDWLLNKPVGMDVKDHLEAAEYYLVIKDYQQAIKHFEKVLESEPDNANLYYRIATLYALDSKNTLALDWLEKAIQKGFALKKILYYDPSLEALRNTKKYKELIVKNDLQSDPKNTEFLEEG